jgi:hypothetical protein
LTDPSNIEDFDRALLQRLAPDEAKDFQAVLDQVKDVPLTQIHLNLTAGVITLGHDGQVIAKDGQAVLPAPSTAEN